MSKRRETTTDIHTGAGRLPAFSMLELLVVFSIIAFLAALLIPSFGKAREQVRRIVCSNNLRQWGTAVQFYLEDYKERLPTEGTFLHGGIMASGTWFNELPGYLGLPAYRDLDGVNDAIRELPNIHAWICPSKNLTEAYKSGSGKNQIHYGMNQVLDGLGKAPDGSRDTPGFPDQGTRFVHATIYRMKPSTVFLFDIAPNSPAGTPRQVATKYQRSYQGSPIGVFHGDFANVLYIDGSVGHCVTDDLVTNRDFRYGDVVWTEPKLYWGYPPP